MMLDEEIGANAVSPDHAAALGGTGVFHKALAAIQAGGGMSDSAAFDVFVGLSEEWGLDVRETALRIVSEADSQS